MEEGARLWRKSLSISFNFFRQDAEKPGAITAPFGLGTKLDFDDACELALDTILESKASWVVTLFCL